MTVDSLHAGNFVLYAAKNYKSTIFDDAEFFADMEIYKYIKRLFNKYQESGDLKERLILNHIITFYNQFDSTAATRMLFFKLPNHHSLLAPFLDYLGFLPEVVYNIGLSPKNINTIEIQFNQEVAERIHSI